MPFAPPSRCRKCGTRGASLCARCSRQGLVRLRAEHPDSGRGGYDAAWRKLALEAIARQPWCSICGATDDLTGDHIDPRKRTDLTLADVRTLCRRCNSRRGDR